MPPLVQERPCGHVWWPLPREVKLALSAWSWSEEDCWEGDWRGGLEVCEDGLRCCAWAAGLFDSAAAPWVPWTDIVIAEGEALKWVAALGDNRSLGVGRLASLRGQFSIDGRIECSGSFKATGSPSTYAGLVGRSSGSRSPLSAESPNGSGNGALGLCAQMLVHLAVASTSCNTTDLQVFSKGLPDKMVSSPL